MPHVSPPDPLAPADAPAHGGVAGVDLASYTSGGYQPGRGPIVRLLWWFTSLALLESGWFLLTRLKPTVLRCFGAKIGQGVVIKPHVRIKYPWRLTIGDHCWIGQDVWIDNLADVTIGQNVCVSQGTYFCTGSHDHRRRSFDLITRLIVIENGAWLGAKAILLGGVRVGTNAILSAGSVANRDVPPATIAAGNPAVVVRERPPIA
ncbi:WcaF family extracellular polysaccharide biosynthesis acetyltransferase [Botrimarina hoheduenensis]|uniref:Galactoside O-acetyltransferase n=1 Tax=Botrimarina hoheduenensis TaxID=2528000 RepID=A0A5C5WDN9_9BACT|nr:WcaF family extracellular polysaccharide biosynthesis acetyltransferase [Botrimarina hoheduenensis]TWT47802.1 Galactoside O-acetyltransferase [Botrimarina hoheduenensis]